VSQTTPFSTQGAQQSRDIAVVEPLERETINRIFWRLMPLLMLGWFCNFLDRMNVGMAAPTMNHDLGFSNAVFGFGAGLFFFGYLLAELPSNLFLNKLGARRWIARILLTWGIVAGLTALVWNDWSYYAIRFILGLGEAGFFPGVVLYLTWWFPSYYRARMQARFYSAGMVALVIGPPLGGLLLHLDGALGLHGWQWLFIVEAFPPIIMSVVTWKLLTDKPADATWLRPDQKAWLIGRLDSERAQREAIRKFTLAQVFCSPKIWVLTAAYFGNTMVAYGLMFFMPLIVKGLGVSTNMLGVVAAVPYLFAFVAVNYWGWHSDKTGDRVWHVVASWLLAASGLAACTLIGVGHPIITMLALILAVMGQQSVPSIFWSIPSSLLTGTAAAGGIAMINAIGSMGGWLGPSVFGLVKDATGSDNIALLSLALAPVISSILLVLVGHDRRLERIPRS
jgi:ACS family tartrate transporter-like MFS transporter